MPSVLQMDCTQEMNLCRSHHIQGFPTIRVFRKGHDEVKNAHGQLEHESYTGVEQGGSPCRAHGTTVNPSLEPTPPHALPLSPLCIAIYRGPHHLCAGGARGVASTAGGSATWQSQPPPYEAGR